jgi:hypothetical protein
MTRPLYGRPLALVAIVAALAACDEKKDTTSAAPGAASSAPVKEAPEAPAVDRAVEITVDGEGFLVAGDRASGGERLAKMRELVGKVDLKGKPPVVVALRSAKAGDVAALFGALAGVGATEVSVRTQDRSKKDVSRAMVPDTKAGKLADCTVALMVQKDRTTASWPIRGGMATRYAKGMAGPDLSMTLEGVKKQVAACTSTAMVISGDDGVEWGLVFDLSQMATTADPPLKVSSFVVAHEALTAGRKVTLD